MADDVKPETMHLFRAAAELEDDVIWSLALIAVGLAGHRAQKLGRKDIESACDDFYYAITTARRKG
jgi:hypothetical protein